MLPQFLFIFSCLIGLNAAQTYCPPNYTATGPSSLDDTDLGPTSLQGSGKSIADTTGCTFGSAGGTAVTRPRNLTATQIAELIPGHTYTLNYFIGTCKLNYSVIYGAWIDYNQNFIWETGTSSIEEILFFQSAPNTQGPYGAFSRQFTVPKTALLGQTVMRLQVQEDSRAVPPMDVCKNFPYGATKDFGIIIINPSASGSGVSGGTIFLIIFILGVFFYILGGCVYNRQKKATTGMRDSCPQNEFWLNELPSLVKDGMMYTKIKVLGICRKGDGFGPTDEDL